MRAVLAHFRFGKASGGRKHALPLIVPLLCISLALHAAPVEWIQYSILPGTDFAAQYYVADTALQGPRVLLIAPHSDEESAGQALDAFISDYKPLRGALVICPWPVTPAKRLKSRSYIEDLNRQYAYTEDNNTAIDVIAQYIQSWLLMYKIDYVLNIHEGYGKFRHNWSANYGQGIFVDAPERIPLASAVARQVNARIANENHFLVAQIPMPTTLTWYCQSRGIPAFGIEIQRELRMDRRILYQKIVLEEFFRAIGLPIEAQKK